MTGPPKKLLGELLVEDGALTRDQLREALDQQKKAGGLIGEILVSLGYITEESLTVALARQLDIPYLPIENYSLNQDAVALFDEPFLRRHIFLPFDRDEKRLFLAIANPLNDQAVSEIEQTAKLKPQVFISTRSEILNSLDIIFRVSAPKNPGLKKAG